MSRIVLAPKPLGETRRETFDFSSRLASGETLTGASGSASVYSGTDASPSALLQGSASVSGALAYVTLTGGVVGVLYEILCTATTSAGQVLTLSAYLALTPDLQ
jgi:hypothetical protein